MARKRVTAPARPRDLDILSDVAHIGTHDVARMTGYKQEYIRRKSKADPTFPQPVARTGEGPRGPLWYRMGDIRKYLIRRGKK